MTSPPTLPDPSPSNNNYFCVTQINSLIITVNCVFVCFFLYFDKLYSPHDRNRYDRKQDRQNKHIQLDNIKKKKSLKHFIWHSSSAKKDERYFSNIDTLVCNIYIICSNKIYDSSFTHRPVGSTLVKY